MLLIALRRSLILAAAIASSTSAQIVGTNADSIPRGLTSYFESFDEGARAAGLAPLRETALRPGEREVRIWTLIEISSTRELYRLTEAEGRVRGERFHISPASTAMSYWLKGSCDELPTAESVQACRVRFVKAPRWERVLRTAEANGLWKLPDPSTLPPPKMILNDGWTIAFELRDGPRYRAVLYNNPGLNDWPSEAQVGNIVLTLFALDSLERRPDAYKVYRGLTTGLYHSAFTLCNGDGPWEFYGDLRSLLKRGPAAVRAAAPRQLVQEAMREYGSRQEEIQAVQHPTDSTTVYELELLGALSPESAPLTQSRSAPLLHVIELRSVRVARPGGCTTRARH